MTRRIHILARWKWISAVVIIIVLGTFTLASIKLDYRFVSLGEETSDLSVNRNNWLDGWNYRVPIIINNTASSENLENFPVLVHLTDSNFNFSKAEVDGADIRFYNGTSLLDYEIENWGNITTYNENWGAAIFNGAISVMERNIATYCGHQFITPDKVAYPKPYCWDTPLNALGALYFNPALARESFDASFATQITSRGDYYGMIPNAPEPTTTDETLRSQTPVIAYAIWQYYLKTGDKGSLEKWYPLLGNYYNWYNVTGSPPGSIDGLTAPHTGRSRVDTNTAYYIAGSVLDNHVVYDYTDGATTKIGDTFYYFNMSDLQLSCAMALFAKNLADMSDVLGYSANKTLYENEYISKTNLINHYMWNDTSHIYQPCFWNGTKFPVESAQMFWALLAEVANSTQADYLRRELVSASKFNGTWGIPDVSMDDPKFDTPQPSWMHSFDSHYWRGQIWAPVVYAAYEGMKNYGFTNEASQILSNYVKLIKTTHFFETHSVKGGYGGNRDDYGWTAALMNAMIAEETAVSDLKDAWIWVVVPSLPASSLVTIYMYFGNPEASDSQNAQNVWDSNYVAIFHMNGTSDKMLDSTSHDTDMSVSGLMLRGNTEEGLTGNFLNFDGRRVVMKNASSIPQLDAANTTWSLWFKPNMFYAPGTLIVRYPGGTGEGQVYITWLKSDKKIYADIPNVQSDVIRSSTVINSTAWKYITLTQVGKNWTIYVDGVAENSTVATQEPVLAGNLYFGASYFGGYNNFFNGWEDEIRVSNIGRSAEWIKAEYLSMAGNMTKMATEQEKVGDYPRSPWR